MHRSGNSSAPHALVAVLLFSFMCLGKSSAQTDSILSVVELDPVVVQAQEDGFNVESFVLAVMEDTTFYQAFLNMKTFPHTVRSGLVVRNKKEKEKASLNREGRLKKTSDTHVEMILSKDEHTGNLKNRKGEYRYMTAEMYDEVFWPKGSYRADNSIRSREQELVRGSKIEEYKSELKKFMFNPGQEIGTVPFIGDKMALFDDHMIEYYDYSIWSDKRSGRACWVFSAEAKQEERPNRTVIKSMDTWFDKNTWQVRARHYHIQHSTIFLDFNIRIKVENVSMKGQIIPMSIDYDGDFDIPLKKPEIVKFWLRLNDWEVPDPE